MVQENKPDGKGLPEEEGLTEIQKELIEEDKRLAAEEARKKALEKPPLATAEEMAAEEEARRSRLQPKGGVSQFNAGELVKPAIVSLIVTFIVITLMAIAGGGSFLTKKDFEANLANMNAVVAQASADLAAAKKGVDNAVASLPGTISTQVNSSISQATSQLSGKINTLTTQVSDLSSKVQGNTTSATSLTASIAELQSRIDDLQAEVADYETRIEELEEAEKTTTDTTSTTSGDVTIFVNTAPAQVYSGDTYQYWISVTNNSGVGKKVYIEAIATISGTVPSGMVVNTTTKYTINSPSSPPMTDGYDFAMSFIPSRISGVSKGYVLLAPGGSASIGVQLVLVYDTPAGLWVVNFVPIAINL